jgi:hypothetical protein
MNQEGNNLTRNRNFEEQLRLGRERTTNEGYGKAIGPETVKRAVGISNRFPKMRK